MRSGARSSCSPRSPSSPATWSRYAAGERGPDLHVHRGHTDAFYVLDGELTFAVGPPGGGARRRRRLRRGAAERRAHVRQRRAPPRRAGSTSTPRTAASPRTCRPPAATARDAPWDSFDPPADGGRPASDAARLLGGRGRARGAGGPRRACSRACLPDLPRDRACARRPVPGGPDVQRADGHVDAYFAADARVVHVRAPGSA